jgi:hypothetical protein
MTVEKSGSRPGVGNDRTGTRLAVSMPGCATTAAGLHLNGDICGAFLNCTRTMWKNERQAGETTGN